MKTYEVELVRTDSFEVQAETPEEADAIIWRLHVAYTTEAGANLDDSDEGDPVYWADGEIDIPQDKIKELAEIPIVPA